MTASTVATGITAITTKPWRNPAFVTSDGYRVVLYNSGTSLYAATNNPTINSTWTSINLGVPVTATSWLETTASCWYLVPGRCQHLVVLAGDAGPGSTSLSLYHLAYAGGGTWAATAATPYSPVISQLSTSVQSVVLAAPDLQTPNPAGTGYIHALLDQGTQWSIVAFQPTSLAADQTWSVTYSGNVVLTPPISSPYANTNMILRKTGHLYAVGGGPSGWQAYEVQFQHYNGTVPASSLNVWAQGNLTLPASNNPDPSFGVHGTTTTVAGVTTTRPNQLNASNFGDTSFAGPLTTDLPLGGQSWSAQTWTYVLNGTNVNSTGYLGVNVYLWDWNLTTKTFASLQPFGKLSANPAAIDGQSTFQLTASGTVPAFSLAPGHGLALTLEILCPVANPVTVGSGSGNSAQTGTIQLGNAQFTIPNPTGIQNGYVVVSGPETPTTTFPPSPAGCALVANLETDPSVDLLATDTIDQIWSVRRYATGYYSPNPAPVGTGPRYLAGRRLDASIDPATGNAACWGIGIFNTTATTVATPSTAGYNTAGQPIFNLNIAATAVSPGQMVRLGVALSTAETVIVQSVSSVSTNVCLVTATGPLLYNHNTTENAFLGLSQPGYMVRSGGAWGAWTSISAANGVHAVTGIAPPGPNAYGALGPGTAFSDNTGTLWFDNNNVNAGFAAPTLPTPYGLVDNTGLNDAFGSVSPFNTIAGYPGLFGTFNHPVSYDTMSSRRWLITGQGSNPPSYWDSGQVPVNPGWPLIYPGMAFQEGMNSVSGAPAPLQPGAYNLYLYTWDTISGQQSPSYGGAVVPQTFHVYTPAYLTIARNTMLTTLSNAFTIYQFQAEYLPLVAWQIQFLVNGTNQVVLDTGMLPVPPGQPTQSTAVAVTTVNPTQPTAILAHNLAPGTQVVFAPTGNGRTDGIDFMTTSGTPTHVTGGYQTSFTTAFQYGHTVGGPVYAGFQTTAVSLWPGLANNTVYQMRVLLAHQPPTGSAIITPGDWAGREGTYPLLMNLPTPPQPVITAAVPTTRMTDTTPVAGGNVALTWTQSAPGTGQVVASSWNIYHRLSGTTAWTLVRNIAIQSGQTGFTLHDYSVGNLKPYDFAVSALDQNGVESGLTVVSNITCEFRRGIWLNDPDDPATGVELGRMQGNAAYPTYDPDLQRNILMPFGGGDPIVTGGALDAFHWNTALDYAIDRGYEDTIVNLLHTWTVTSKTVQIRDYWGNVYYGVINVSSSANVQSQYRIVRLQVQKTRAGEYGALSA